ncbi:MAG TPA: class A beta-lactamase-related serine hydrolase [Bacteroidales bacterium]|nr:class A beta-lactamase-related serine hydrolase [Bacteroidales bacterium]
MENKKTISNKKPINISEEKRPKNPFFSKLMFWGLFLLIGLTMGFFIGNLSKNKAQKEKVQDAEEYSEMRAGGYEFTNPLLDCDNYRASSSRNLVDLKNSLDEYIQDALEDDKAKHISVYYRSLNNGPWVGINEHYNYTPASLLKVPIMIAVYKKAEKDTNFLKQKILFDKILEVSTNPNLVDNKSLQIGSTYTIEELIEYMIIHSDNNAKEILMGLIGGDYLMDVMIDCGVNLKNRDLTIDFISIKEYSSFFRILYNASYLDREMSEKALKLLSNVTFDKGLPAKLPKDIKIAHKFGERAFTYSNLKQLHDCGIVYIPNSPYLLCVMTKGDDFNKLVSIIADISEMVYNETNTK